MENLINRVKWIFRVGAISNCLVTVTGVVAPVWAWSGVAHAQKILPEGWQMSPVPALQPPSFLIIWSGMALLWGVVMWEISTNPIKHEDLIKYTYIEKGITTYAITWGVCNHSMPVIVWLGILYTDVFYILLNVYAHFLVRREMRSKT
jgi:hypothetical protein